jgi:hypothetical protein
MIRKCISSWCFQSCILNRHNLMRFHMPPTGRFRYLSSGMRDCDPISNCSHLSASVLSSVTFPMFAPLSPALYLTTIGGRNLTALGRTWRQAKLYIPLPPSNLPPITQIATSATTKTMATTVAPESEIDGLQAKCIQWVSLSRL